MGCENDLFRIQPEVETLPAMVDGPFTFTLQGNIMFEGNSNVTARGFTAIGKPGIRTFGPLHKKQADLRILTSDE